MAEAILLPIVKSILGKIASTAGDVASEYIVEELKAAKSAKQDLEKIADQLPAICAVLQDAGEKQYANEAIKLWLRDLKSVVYDINDILDEVATDALRRKVNDGLGDKLRYYFSSSNPLISRFDLSHKIRDLREKLDEIIVKKNKFGLTENPYESSVVERDPLDACAYVNSSAIVGRDEAKQDIMSKLAAVGDALNVSVLPIVGMGGLGKTALAKLVYQDVDGFDVKLWTCVSDKFEIKKIIGDIIKNATDENTLNQSLEWLVRKLQDLLKGKKYFLVLDDVWVEDIVIWTELKNMLAVGSSGSIILVTTRLANVASITQTTEPYNLDRLPNPVCWSIFKQLAFKDEGEEERYPNLVKIGSSIIEKCGGVPLAVKALGSLLRSERNEQEWERIDKMENFTKLHSRYDNVMRVLKLSYDKLPSHLKPCLATFSFQVKDTSYNSATYVYYWRALGLLQTNESDETGGEGYAYFTDLLSRSFLQEADVLYDETVRSCKMHDLFHDLVTNIMGEELAVVTSNELKVSEMCKHIIWGWEELSDKKFPKEILKAKKAHMFRFGHKMGYISQSFLEGIISNLTSLRILDLSSCSYEKLPSSIGNMKHLRVLDLSYNPIIKRLPNTICKLLNLQMLLINDCEQLEELPRDMDKLLNLRYLSMSTRHATLDVSKIGNLPSLRKLELCSCEELTWMWDDDIVVGPLTSFKHCFIKNSPKLTCLPSNMKFLEKLEILGCEALDLEERECLNGLQSLRSLDITGLPKLVRLPDGLQSAATSLQYLFIDDCEGLTELPDWFQHFGSLKKLIIYNCPKLLALPKGFPQLKLLRNLQIKNCPHLTERCAIPNGEDYSLIQHVSEIWLDGKYYWK